MTEPEYLTHAFRGRPLMCIRCNQHAENILNHDLVCPGWPDGSSDMANRRMAQVEITGNGWLWAHHRQCPCRECEVYRFPVTPEI